MPPPVSNDSWTPLRLRYADSAASIHAAPCAPAAPAPAVAPASRDAIATVANRSRTRALGRDRADAAFRAREQDAIHGVPYAPFPTAEVLAAFDAEASRYAAKQAGKLERIGAMAPGLSRAARLTYFLAKRPFRKANVERDRRSLARRCDGHERRLDAHATNAQTYG